MSDRALMPWHDGIDPATIPDAILASERGRRNAAKRQTRTGGNVWAKHSPDAARGCRCARCWRKREAAAVSESA